MDLLASAQLNVRFEKKKNTIIGNRKNTNGSENNMWFHDYCILFSKASSFWVNLLNQHSGWIESQMQVQNWMNYYIYLRQNTKCATEINDFFR